MEQTRMLDKLPPGTGWVLRALKLLFVSQGHKLNKVSLNRNAQNTRSCVNQLSKMLLPSDQEPDPRHPLGPTVQFLLTGGGGVFVDKNQHKQ